MFNILIIAPKDENRTYLRKVLENDAESNFSVIETYHSNPVPFLCEQHNFDAVIFSDLLPENGIIKSINDILQIEPQITFLLFNTGQSNNDISLDLIPLSQRFGRNQNKQEVSDLIIQSIGLNELNQQNSVNEQTPWGHEENNPKYRKRKHQRSTLFLCCSIFILGVLATLISQYYYSQTKFSTFVQQQKQEWISPLAALHTKCKYYFHALKSISDYFSLSPPKNQHDFIKIASSFFQNYENIFSIQWINQDGKFLYSYPWRRNHTFFQNHDFSNLNFKKDNWFIHIDINNNNQKKYLSFGFPVSNNIRFTGIPIASIELNKLLDPIAHHKGQYDHNISIEYQGNTIFGTSVSDAHKIQLASLDISTNPFIYFLHLKDQSLHSANLPFIFIGICISTLLTIIVFFLRLRSFQKELDIEWKMKMRTHQINRYKRIFHVSHDALFVIGDQDHIVLTNHACQELFSYQEGFLNGKPIGLILPELHREKFDQSFSSFFRELNLKEEQIMELTAQRKDGSKFIASVSIARFKYYLWNQYIVMVRDISELVAFRKYLIEKNEELRNLDESKNVFLSNVTHELRTPLTAIISSANMLIRSLDRKTKQQASPRELIENSLVDQEFNQDVNTAIKKVISAIDDYVPIIQGESERLLQMVNEVLDLAKIRAGKMEWLFEYVDPKIILEKAFQNFKSLATEKNIDYTIDQYNHNALVFADSNRILQVLSNLISNALKFTPEHGKITLGLKVDEQTVQFFVEDNGIGISDKDQDRIFGRFVQIESSQRGKPKGSGLGLSISKQIVLSHGGTIGVSTPSNGQGTKFWVNLPVQNPDQQKQVPLIKHSEYHGI